MTDEKLRRFQNERVIFVVSDRDEEEREKGDLGSEFDY